jgi:hypothetical protein
LAVSTIERWYYQARQVPTSQVDSAHGAGAVAVGEAAFQGLTSAAKETLATLAANPSPFGIGSSPFCGFAGSRPPMTTQILSDDGLTWRIAAVEYA